MWFTSIVIGVLSVLVGVLILRHELNQAIRAIPKDADSAVKRSDLDELNASFFDIANDLEGKYSIHEKQIQKMEDEVTEMQLKQKQVDILLSKNSEKNNDQIPKSISLSSEKISEEQKDNSRNINRNNYNNYNKENNQNNRSGEPEGRASVDKKHEAQKMLAEGQSVPEIAKKLGMGVSELSLMLGMKKY